MHAMSITEKDPRNIGYIALFIAITWYREIHPETAIRIAAVHNPPASR